MYFNWVNVLIVGTFAVQLCITSKVRLGWYAIVTRFNEIIAPAGLKIWVCRRRIHMQFQLTIMLDVASSLMFASNMVSIVAVAGDVHLFTWWNDELIHKHELNSTILVLCNI